MLVKILPILIMVIVSSCDNLVLKGSSIDIGGNKYEISHSCTGTSSNNCIPNSDEIIKFDISGSNSTVLFHKPATHVLELTISAPVLITEDKETTPEGFAIINFKKNLIENTTSIEYEFQYYEKDSQNRKKLMSYYTYSTDPCINNLVSIFISKDSLIFDVNIDYKDNNCVIKEYLYIDSLNTKEPVTLTNWRKHVRILFQEKLENIHIFENSSSIITDYIYSEKYAGEGSEDRPYIISNPGNLLYLSEKGCNKFNYEDCDKHFELSSNIDLSKVYRQFSIGNFSGVFDGKGHYISGFKAFGVFQSGLFEGLSGKIKNLKLLNSTILPIPDGTIYSSFLSRSKLEPILTNGILTPTAVDAFIENVQIENGSVKGLYTAGGIAGRIKYSHILNSHTDIDVHGAHNAGGIAGDLIESNISKTYAKGKVLSKKNAGGLVGRNDGGSISDSYATGDVTAMVRSAGGIVGYNMGSVINCYASNNVTMSGLSPDEIDGCAVLHVNGETKNCYWNKDVNGLDGIGARTSEELKQESTFENWDFETIWEIEENLSYPFLKD